MTAHAIGFAAPNVRFPPKADRTSKPLEFGSGARIYGLALTGIVSGLARYRDHTRHAIKVDIGIVGEVHTGLCLDRTSVGDERTFSERYSYNIFQLITGVV